MTNQEAPNVEPIKLKKMKWLKLETAQQAASYVIDELNGIDQELSEKVMKLQRIYKDMILSYRYFKVNGLISFVPGTTWKPQK